MKSFYSEPVKGNRYARAKGDEIRLGIASWDKGDGELSVKYTWHDSRGRAARGGEVPIWALQQMMDVAGRGRKRTR